MRGARDDTWTQFTGPVHGPGICVTCWMAERAELLPGQFAVAIAALGGTLCIETFRWPRSLEGAQADLPPPALDDAGERTEEILALLLDRLAIPPEPLVLLLDPALPPPARNAALRLLRAETVLEVRPEDPALEEAMITEIGIDPGFGNIKIALADPRHPPVVLPAVFTMGALHLEDAETDLPLLASQTTPGRPRRGLPPFHRVEVNGVVLTVGDIGRRARATRRLDLARFEGGPDLQALLLAALRRMFRQAEEIRVRAVVGLPIAVPRRSATAEAFRKWLTAAPHRGVVDDRPFTVIFEEIRLVPQPMGAYYGYVIDPETARVHPERIRQRVGVVDVGHNTLDISVFQGGREEGLHTLGRQLGIWRAGDLMVRNGTVGTPEAAEIMLREDPEAPAVRAALYQLGADIATALSQAMGDQAALRDVHHWILTGGGMAFSEIREGIARMLPPGRFSVPKNPVTANAQGMALAARLLWGRKEGEGEGEGERHAG